MDALSNVLRTTRLTGGVFLHAELSDPWCLGVKVSPEACAPFIGAPAEVIPYHYVLEGRVCVRVGDGPSCEMEAGELAIFPQNDYHLLGSDLTLTPTPSDGVVQPSNGDGLARIRFGGGGSAARLICGFLTGEDLANNPLVGTLPKLLHLDYRNSSAATWIRTTLAYAADEIAGGRMGSETVFGKISELLFVEAVRRHAEALPRGETGWLAGLNDPYVARALALLHARFKESWTLDRLGREVGLSRTALADRFRQLIGMPPMQYLTRWRMQTAARELLNTRKSIAEIAVETGYDTEAAFSRAFKRTMGGPPAAWRRQRS